MANQLTVKAEGHVLTLEREFNAPRDLVFRAFSEAEHLKHWWGPRGWTLTVCNVDFRPGGVWHYCMKCIDENQGDFYGMESWGRAVYGEINRPESFGMTDSFSDAEGNVVEGLPTGKSTYTFTEQGGKTKLVNQTVYETPEALKTVLEMGMEQGIRETFDRLDEFVQKLQE